MRNRVIYETNLPATINTSAIASIFIRMWWEIFTYLYRNSAFTKAIYERQSTFLYQTFDSTVLDKDAPKFAIDLIICVRKTLQHFVCSWIKYENTIPNCILWSVIITSTTTNFIYATLFLKIVYKSHKMMMCLRLWPHLTSNYLWMHKTFEEYPIRLEY